MLNIYNGTDEVSCYRIIRRGSHNIVPELFALLASPTVGTLVNRDDELFFPIQEGKKLILNCFHICPPKYRFLAYTDDEL